MPILNPLDSLADESRQLSATERERMYALPNRGVQGIAAPL